MRNIRPDPHHPRGATCYRPSTDDLTTPTEGSPSYTTPPDLTGRHARDYYEASAPSKALGRQRTYPPRRVGHPGRGGNPEMVPTFTMRSIGQ